MWSGCEACRVRVPRLLLSERKGAGTFTGMLKSCPAARMMDGTRPLAPRKPMPPLLLMECHAKKLEPKTPRSCRSTTSSGMPTPSSDLVATKMILAPGFTVRTSRP